MNSGANRNNAVFLCIGSYFGKTCAGSNLGFGDSLMCFKHERADGSMRFVPCVSKITQTVEKVITAIGFINPSLHKQNLCIGVLGCNSRFSSSEHVIQNDIAVFLCAVSNTLVYNKVIPRLGLQNVGFFGFGANGYPTVAGVFIVCILGILVLMSRKIPRCVKNGNLDFNACLLGNLREEIPSISGAGITYSENLKRLDAAGLGNLTGKRRECDRRVFPRPDATVGFFGVVSVFHICFIVVSFLKICGGVFVALLRNTRRSTRTKERDQGKHQGKNGNSSFHLASSIGSAN